MPAAFATLGLLLFSKCSHPLPIREQGDEEGSASVGSAPPGTLRETGREILRIIVWRKCLSTRADPQRLRVAPGVFTPPQFTCPGLGLSVFPQPESTLERESRDAVGAYGELDCLQGDMAGAGSLCSTALTTYTVNSSYDSWVKWA